MVSRRPLLPAAVLAVLAGAMPAGAQQAEPAPADVAETEVEDDPFALDVHAFVSQGFILSLRNNYLAKAKNGSFEFAEAGINFTKPLSDRLRVGLQLFAHDLGPLGNYDVSVDWFYLDYKVADWFGLRAGRVKLPFGLYNEINDIDAARPFVLLPQAMYPVENRDFLLAQTGVELYGYIDMGSSGALDYRLYGGTILLEDTSSPTSPTKITDINIPYIVGGRLLWETPFEGLRAGGSVQALRLDIDAIFDPMVVAAAKMMGRLPATATGALEAKIHALLAVASIEYAAYDWLLAAEYSRWIRELESSEPALAPETNTTAERMYALVAYRITSWLQPGAYYALYFPDTADRTGRHRQQSDVALTLRFDINEHWLVKLEGHYFNGTAQLKSALNDGKKITALKRNWAVLLVKTTAYF